MEKAESLWLIDEAELPASFRYPPELKRIIQLGLTNLVSPPPALRWSPFFRMSGNGCAELSMI